MPQIENILTQNGNLKSDAHKQIKAQYHDFIVNDVEFLPTENGDYAKHVADAVARDADGNIVELVPIYVRLELIVTTKDPFPKKNKAGKKESQKQEIFIPDLT